jgi:hypothetical protein
MVAGRTEAITYTAMDLTSAHNYRLADMDGAAENLPTGWITGHDDVPFYIPPVGNNVYVTALPTGAGMRVLETPVRAPSVVQVHALLNTWWGSWSSTPYAYLEFFGSAGAYYRKDLLGNVDVRDYLESDYTNRINGTTTRNLALAGNGKYDEVRLDQLRIDLPGAFLSQDLERVRLVDLGDTGFQRTFVAGITYGAVPEPATGLVLLGLAALGLAGRRRHRRR